MAAIKLTVENICGLLIGSKLLAPDEVKSIYSRWQSEAREGQAASDVAQFTRWLASNNFVTEYQAGLVAKGHTNGYFIGQYKILDRLGIGRTAGVYKAVHQLGQLVAIKVLPPSRAKDRQLLARFQSEAEQAIRLKHPNVLRSFQIGQFKGLHYLVMEFVEGETLEAVLQRRSKLPPAEATRLVHQLLQGLQHMHEQGLVHGDVKPANLMLAPSPAKNEADSTLACTLKIFDIGSGRVLRDEAASGGGLTNEGALRGMPDYVAPELARDPRAIDIRADIYSVGCVFFRALTGQLPNADANALAELASGVGEGLQKVIGAMLDKDPAHRFSTPERAAQALQAFFAADNAPVRSAEEGPQLKNYLSWLKLNPQDKNEAADQPMQAEPAELPGDAAAVQAAAHPEFDVVLVDAPPPALRRRAPGISNRDWLFLALGAGAVICAGSVGFALAWLVRN